MYVNFYFTVAAHEDEDPTLLTVHPDGQNVEILWDLRQPSENETAAWIIGRNSGMDNWSKPATRSKRLSQWLGDWIQCKYVQQ